MPIKKTQLYTHLWEAANALRGGMDASQYKDYVLTILFVKYVTDKYKDKPYNDDGFVVPEGGSFDDILAFKGHKEIGEKINEVLHKLAEDNDLKGVIDKVDFDDDAKLGTGKEKVDKLTKLVSIFENPQLDFSGNHAGGDDILGDVYEYFMKQFATEAGKSKGQFYTPAEVSRTMAKIIGIEKAQGTKLSAYDPACGSGSLLLKVDAEAPVKIALYGQEKDIDVANIARMNMILHGRPDAEIKQGNTLSDPQFKNDDGTLKTFDYAVANPPFSQKNWMDGVNPQNDPYHRFDDGIPPAKNGDYAFLLHFIKSLKPKGKGAIILPHGVLFRGNAEAIIRRNIIRKGYIKGIIGLPPNLFYGTGIPAVILVIDKENATSRKGIFIIDASKGFRKDGNKNRLRERDIHKIVDTFIHFKEIPGYARMVSLAEIEKNDFNLNIPRYIDNVEEEDNQDIYAHLHGGIPARDVDKLPVLNVFPGLKERIFKLIKKNYYRLNIPPDDLPDVVEHSREISGFKHKVEQAFDIWTQAVKPVLEGINEETRPKKLIENISESLLETYKSVPLMDAYAVYQILMDYWDETLKDDVYLIMENGWNAKPQIDYDKKGKLKSWNSDLLPKNIVIDAYFPIEKQEIEDLEAKKEDVLRQLEELTETYSSDDGILEEVKNEKGKITKAALKAKIKELKNNAGAFAEELDVLEKYLQWLETESRLKKQIKNKETELDLALLKKYNKLTPDEVRRLVIDKKWFATLKNQINDEVEDIILQMLNRIKELYERYETPLPEIEQQVNELEQKVKAHLKLMGFEI